MISASGTLISGGTSVRGWTTRSRSSLGAANRTPRSHERFTCTISIRDHFMSFADAISIADLPVVPPGHEMNCPTALGAGRSSHRQHGYLRSRSAGSDWPRPCPATCSSAPTAGSSATFRGSSVGGVREQQRHQLVERPDLVDPRFCRAVAEQAGCDPHVPGTVYRAQQSGSRADRRARAQSDRAPGLGSPACRWPHLSSNPLNDTTPYAFHCGDSRRECRRIFRAIRPSRAPTARDRRTAAPPLRRTARPDRLRPRRALCRPCRAASWRPCSRRSP